MEETMRSKSISSYIHLVHFLGEVLGPDYEIALHDAKKPSQSIVAIVNNHISGRDIGAPLTDWAAKLIDDKEYLRSNYIASYNSLAKDNQLIRSSMFFIKDGNELIGLLCINFDSSRYLDLSKSVLQLCHPDYLVEKNYNFTPDASALDIPETFSSTIAEMTDSVLNDYFAGEKIPPSRLTKAERLKIVRTLSDKGVFLVKGSVGQVAAQLCCSESTIYRYLNKIESKASV